MNDAEFLQRYRETLKILEETVEEAINDRDAAIDYESGNDMLTLSFTNKTVVILSRQTAIHQLWMAARSGGFHFDFDATRNTWICTVNHESLPVMLEEICKSQGGVDMQFPLPR